MSDKIGLKLFSNNISSIKKAREYYLAGLFDYLELMAIPGTYRETIKYWKKLKLPYIIHAPHGKYGFNLSLPDMRKQNEKLFRETQKFADDLGADMIIVHPGLTGMIDETARQIKKINDSRIVIENNPYISLFQTKCVGSSPEEIRCVMKATGVKFCLDIAHAIKSAYVRGISYKEYIRRFLELRPKIVHICDCGISGCFDEHQNLGHGEVEFKEILAAMAPIMSGMHLTLEVPEKNYKQLKAFRKDRMYIDKLLRMIKK